MTQDKNSTAGDIASGIPVAVGVGFAEPTTDVEAQIIPRETMGDSDEEYSEEDYEYDTPMKMAARATRTYRWMAPLTWRMR